MAVWRICLLKRRRGTEDTNHVGLQPKRYYQFSSTGVSAINPEETDSFPAP